MPEPILSGETTELSEKQPGRNPPVQFRFTPQNARAMAERAARVRLAKKQREKERERLLAELTDPTPLVEKQERVEAQLNRLDKLIDLAESGKEMIALVQAKERLLNCWALLTGFPRPGVRKQTKPGRNAPNLQPVVNQSDPVPGTEQSGSDPTT